MLSVLAVLFSSLILLKGKPDNSSAGCQLVFIFNGTAFFLYIQQHYNEQKQILEQWCVVTSVVFPQDHLKLFALQF